jgi:ketosteroid isomerase-like protein
MQADQPIRAARAASNVAIARRDVEAIVSFLLPTYHIVTGRGVARGGIEASRRSWRELFRGDPAVQYVRTPREIRVNEALGLAHEVGEWTGTHTAEGAPVRVSGVYAAQWQRVADGRWLLAAEIFTMLAG